MPEAAPRGGVGRGWWCVAAAATLVLAGCGSGSGPRLSAAQEQAFLAQVHDNSADVSSYRSDPQLVQLGEAACSGFASGVSFQALADRLAQEVGSLPTSDLGTVIVAAATHLCPTYRSEVS